MPLSNRERFFADQWVYVAVAVCAAFLCDTVCKWIS